MMEIIAAWGVKQIAVYAGASLGAILLAWILKRIPNDKIKIAVGEVCYRLGVLITLGLAKWKFTKPFWNKVIEPWFIDLLDNVVGHGLKEFIRGLRSD